MERTMLIAVLAVFALLSLLMMYRVLKGPRFTDRIVAVNAINTMIIASICISSRLLNEAYLLDIALIFALLGFTATVLLMRIISADSDKEDKK